MSSHTAEVVICGAGIAGIAAAYHLAVRRGVRGIVLVDERPPLSLTSDKSTECYRNWWPGPGNDMVALMNRSIDLLEELARESGNAFRMNRRGYLFATADPAHVPVFVERAREAEARGVGPARIHRRGASDYRPAPADGFENQPTGVDVITDPALALRHFPYLAPDTLAVLHARRCGWFSGHQLGMYLLERAREAGVRLLEGRVERIDARGGRVRSVRVSARGGEMTVATPRFVDAAGPFFAPVARLLGVEVPVFCERHAKVAFNDTLGAMPRSAPMTIWTDPVTLPWSDEERRDLAASAEHKRLVEDGAGAGGVPFSPASGRRRRRLLHEDPREPVPRGPLADRGRLRAGGPLRPRPDGLQRRGRSAGRPHHGAPPSGVRAGVPLVPVRRPGVPGAPRAVGRLGAALNPVNAEGER